MRVFQGMEEPCISAKDIVFLQVLKYVSTMIMAESKSNICCFNIASCNLPVKPSGLLARYQFEITVLKKSPLSIKI